MYTKEKRLFGRYSREECGLPPNNADLFGDRLGVGGTVVILVLLAGASLLAGRMHAGHRELWVRSLPALVARAGDDAEQRSALMRRGAVFAAALPDRPRVRRDLAFAAMAATEYAPRRLGYIGNALALLKDVEPPADETPIEAAARETALSGLYDETGDHASAFAALDRAEKSLPAMENKAAERAFRLLLVNAQAYGLATLGQKGGNDMGRALRLAELAVSSRDELPGGGFASASAAFVDTLATARFGNNLAEEAVDTQCIALGLASSRELAIYLKHFDTFSSGTASKGEPYVQ